MAVSPSTCENKFSALQDSVLLPPLSNGVANVALTLWASPMVFFSRGLNSLASTDFSGPPCNGFNCGCLVLLVIVFLQGQWRLSYK